jgi:hypothetical protein
MITHPLKPKIMAKKSNITPPRKTYVFTKHSVNGTEKFTVTIDDLTPVYHKRNYGVIELANLLNFKLFEPDWKQEMLEEYKHLYDKWKVSNNAFFLVKKYGIIVIPGTYLYPTTLTEEDIKLMDKDLLYNPYKK